MGKRRKREVRVHLPRSFSPTTIYEMRIAAVAKNLAGGGRRDLTLYGDASAIVNLVVVRIILSPQSIELTSLLYLTTKCSSDIFAIL